MQIELLKDVVSSIAGERAKGIIDLLNNKKNVNEFLIAKKLSLTINQTRNILYRLADEGLVSFARKKDNKKGGWYTYFWTLNQGRSLMKFRDKLLEKTNNLKKQRESKITGRFYYCPNGDLELNEDNAIISNYTCSECGEVLQLKDNTKEIAQLEKDIAKSELMLSGAMQEIQSLQEKEEKARNKRIKVEEQKKATERAEKRKKRQREAKKGRKAAKAIKTKKKKSKR